MQKIFLKYISILLLLIISFNSGFSQIVNIEKNRKGNKDGFQGTADFEFSLKNSGNKIFELKNNIDIQYKKKATTLIFINNIKYLRLDTGNLINDGFIHLRYNYNLRDTSFLVFESFFQAQYNANKLLKERIIGGIGPRFRIAEKEKFKLYTAQLFMYEYEQLTDSMHSITKLLRLDFYVNTYFTLNNKISFNYITYYQPAFSDFKDFRMSGEISSRFDFTKNFALDIGYSADYDSKPPENIQKLFYYFRTKFVFKF
jgi:putative salt-induced outer membrane protein YdiY